MNNDKFKKLLDKKKSEGAEPMSGPHMKAKAHVLGGLMNELTKMGGADLGDHMKKVTVAANTNEGLQHGLGKAADLVAKGPLHAMSHDEMGDSGNEPDESDGDQSDQNHDSDEDPAHEAMESPETESAEHHGEMDDGMNHEAADNSESPEELKAKIAELEHELSKHKSSKFMS